MNPAAVGTMRVRFAGGDGAAVGDEGCQRGMIGIEPAGISAVSRQNQIWAVPIRKRAGGACQCYLGVVVAGNVGAVACDMALGQAIYGQDGLARCLRVVGCR